MRFSIVASSFSRRVRQMYRLALKHPAVSAALAALLLLNLGLAAYLVFPAMGQTTGTFLQQGQMQNQTYPEIAELEQGTHDFKDLSLYFKNLAQKKGAPYAYEVLKRMPFVPNLDMHLLGHTLGDELYKQQGIQGIKVCTQDFRNACSHSVVIGVLLAEGVSALPKIAETCRQAPGGPGAYTMCYHGLGHGVLSFVKYEMPEAIELCKKMGTAAYREREYIECVGGTVMELISGVHDPDLRAEKAAKYFKKDDPLYPCDAGFMPEEVRSICYVYITPHLFEAAGGDLGNPSPSTFEKAFSFCAKIPESQIDNRLACYGGFGKEFPVLSAGRDIRVVDQLPDEKLKTIFTWCQLAHDKQGAQACSMSVISSLYWGGENPAAGAVRYCSLIPAANKIERLTCFDGLQTMVSFYARDAASKNAFCLALPEDRIASCKEYFKL